MHEAFFQGALEHDLKASTWAHASVCLSVFMPTRDY